MANGVPPSRPQVRAKSPEKERGMFSVSGSLGGPGAD